MIGVAVGALMLAGCNEPTPASALPAGDHVHALHEVADGDLLLGLHGALYRSDDQGASWDLAGLEGQDAMSLGAQDPGGLLFVAGHEVLQRSQDGGVTFEPLAPPDLPSLDIHAFAQSTRDPETVYAFVVGFGIFLSTDAGETWQARAAAGQAVGVDTFAMWVDPQDPDVVLAGGGQSGLARSTDGAMTFTPALDAGVGSLTADPDDPDRVVALTSRGVEESVDGGQTWSLLGQPDLDGQPVAIAAGEEGRIWLVTDQPRQLHVSTDGAATWQAAPPA
ncbi:hypothetical protein [Euzebya pacifica]|uniref:WD40/YVTN/BNR-like repeat-containing protein n=1 Tax=Euzebya pacifica TaxID=1608957 RepID=UPI0030FA380B